MSAQARRTARADAAHAVATAPARWACWVPGCTDRGPHAADSAQAAERAAMTHYGRRHAQPAPDDLEEQRAAWIAAGRPPLGEFPARMC